MHGVQVGKLFFRKGKTVLLPSTDKDVLWQAKTSNLLLWCISLLMGDKSIWWMPRLKEAMKDVAKLR